MFPHEGAGNQPIFKTIQIFDYSEVLTLRVHKSMYRYSQKLYKKIYVDLLVAI
jgi:hypothetical protein